jgi:hypothetical protein
MTCSFGDGRPVVANGMCRTHYQREYRGAEVNGPTRTVTPEDVLVCIKKLTAKEVTAKVVTKASGVAPSIRELADCLGVSTMTVHNRLDKLEEEGLITTREGIPRSIVVLEGK